LRFGAKKSVLTSFSLKRTEEAFSRRKRKPHFIAKRKTRNTNNFLELSSVRRAGDVLVVINTKTICAHKTQIITKPALGFVETVYLSISKETWTSSFAGDFRL